MTVWRDRHPRYNETYDYLKFAGIVLVNTLDEPAAEFDVVVCRFGETQAVNRLNHLHRQNSGHNGASMIIGQPKQLEEYAPLSAQEFEILRKQIDPAIAQGVPPETPIQIEFGTVCRLASTVGHFAVQLQKLQNPAPEAAELPPFPILRPAEE